MNLAMYVDIARAEGLTSFHHLKPMGVGRMYTIHHHYWDAAYGAHQCAECDTAADYCQHPTNESDARWMEA